MKSAYAKALFFTPLYQKLYGKKHTGKGLIPCGLLILLFIIPAYATQTASWYSVESCLREGTSGIMANGKKLKDSKYTFACWHLPFGTKVEFTNLRNGKKVIAVCKDRGPSKRLVKQGRLFDLSRITFAQIENLNKGIVKISWKIIYD